MPSKRLRDTLVRLANPAPQRDFASGGTIELSIDNVRLVQPREWRSLKDRGAKRVVVSR